jgi:hypothetical protein
MEFLRGDNRRSGFEAGQNPWRSSSSSARAAALGWPTACGAACPFVSAAANREIASDDVYKRPPMRTWSRKDRSPSGPLRTPRNAQRETVQTWGGRPSASLGRRSRAASLNVYNLSDGWQITAVPPETSQIDRPWFERSASTHWSASATPPEFAMSGEERPVGGSPSPAEVGLPGFGADPGRREAVCLSGPRGKRDRPDVEP